jgi:hypothetical protein
VQVARGERRLRDRNSVLIVPNKHFASVLQLAKNKLAELSRSSGAAQQRVHLLPLPLSHSSFCMRLSVSSVCMRLSVSYFCMHLNLSSVCMRLSLSSDGLCLLLAAESSCGKGMFKESFMLALKPVSAANCGNKLRVGKHAVDLYCMSAQKPPATQILFKRIVRRHQNLMWQTVSTHVLHVNAETSFGKHALGKSCVLT